MRKNIHFFPFCIALLVMCSAVMFGQNPVKPANTPGAQYKKPLVKSTLGKVSGNVSLNAEAAVQVIVLPLKITDDKNVDYLISSYQFAYKRIGVKEDEETGKTSPQGSVVADRFTTTPLPPVWQTNIREGLHSGEELYFFDIIVFDKHGRRFFAPELKISIQ